MRHTATGTPTGDEMNKPTFEYSPVDEHAQLVLANLNNAFAALEALIDLSVPPGRYKSIALTHLETASMFANKGVSKA